MEYFPAPLEKLVEQFAKLPGIGGKSAQRLAFYVLGLSQSEAQEFAQAILDAKQNVTCCPICQNLTAGGVCSICASQKRDASIVCVVADPRDVIAIERAREFNGRYHVLHGVISPMNHIGPDDLQIKSLLDRVGQEMCIRDSSGTVGHGGNDGRSPFGPFAQVQRAAAHAHYPIHRVHQIGRAHV